MIIITRSPWDSARASIETKTKTKNEIKKEPHRSRWLNFNNRPRRFRVEEHYAEIARAALAAFVWCCLCSIGSRWWWRWPSAAGQRRFFFLSNEPASKSNAYVYKKISRVARTWWMMMTPRCRHWTRPTTSGHRTQQRDDDYPRDNDDGADSDETQMHFIFIYVSLRAGLCSCFPCPANYRVAQLVRLKKSESVISSAFDTHQNCAEPVLFRLWRAVSRMIESSARCSQSPCVSYFFFVFLCFSFLSKYRSSPYRLHRLIKFV